MNNKNTLPRPATKVPGFIAFVITVVAAIVAARESLGAYLTAIRSSGMTLRRKLAHSVAAVWVTVSRTRAGLRAIRQSS